MYFCHQETHTIWQSQQNLFSGGISKSLGHIEKSPKCDGMVMVKVAPYLLGEESTKVPQPVKESDCRSS